MNAKIYMGLLSPYSSNFYRLYMQVIQDYKLSLLCRYYLYKNVAIFVDVLALWNKHTRLTSQYITSTLRKKRFLKGSSFVHLNPNGSTRNQKEFCERCLAPFKVLSRTFWSFEKYHFWGFKSLWFHIVDKRFQIELFFWEWMLTINETA